MDLRQVQYEVGHASPLTTLRYDRTNPDPANSSGYQLIKKFGADRAKDGMDADQQ
jgi:hypothetical protein